MNKELYNFYQEYKDKSNAYGLALSVMYVDNATIAPVKGQAYTNKMMSILSTESFLHSTNPESIQKIELLAKEKDLDPILKQELDRFLEKINISKLIPTDVFTRSSIATNESSSAWGKLKEENDYPSFIPYLKNIVDTGKEVLKYHPNKKSNAYDILLDGFEKGTSQEIYDNFFNEIKNGLVPLIKEIQEKGQVIDESILNQKFDIKAQELLANDLCDYLKVNPENCYMSTSHHPFTSFLSLNDVRMTTHYYEDILLSSIYSVIHEYGHALFGLQIDEKFEGSILGRDIGSAMHESQSRLLENHIGKSYAFCKANLDTIKKHFPTLKDLTVDDLYRLVNASKPSLIRTEADELTYPLHVLIRYELEKEIIETDEIDYNELKEKWNNKYQEYLGIVPSDDTTGIMQDMHWSSGYFGYFPTYALGSAYSAQFFNTMKQQIDVDSLLENNQFDVIAKWLKDNIHYHGGSKTANEILLEVTKEEFNPKYYIEYLQDKYRKLYNL